ncbi:MAG: hypothetical protein M3Z04_16185 [Chloroflexota bacterium]|nr:hypothetical protein [Chloroflexota bacterium]
MALLTLSEPVRNWDSLLAGNAAQLKGRLTELISTFLAGANVATPLGARLQALRSVLDHEAGVLRKLQTRQHDEYQRTCTELAQQQRALGGQRGGLLQRLIEGAFNAARALQLWNQRETQALLLESVTTGLEVLAVGSSQVGSAQAHAGRGREIAQAALHTLQADQVARRQALATWREWPPDLQLDYAPIAVRLAAGQEVGPAVLALLLDLPASAEACLTGLQAGVQVAADRLVADLDLSAALDIQRAVEGLSPDLDVDLGFGQAVLNTACTSRTLVWAERPQGRRTLLQLTSDGQLLFEAVMERGAMRAAQLGLPGQIGFLDLTEEITPWDLAVGREARAALAAAQAQHNNLLIDTLVPFGPAPGDGVTAHSNGVGGYPLTDDRAPLGSAVTIRLPDSGAPGN